ncbi:hypothetical protein BGZ70_001013 [Mortierella alpina]|uniref:Uncharacterized protein n=1 Tax=Mortierella alpina TaxID=64518 RepID=A0A9P6IXA8_MORAP|nr:hypothetical protein BGZ70_001013 [Mortierella alpina]
MELSSELAQAPYFSQARQSPVIQEHQTVSSGTSSFLESSHWKPAPVVAEVEAGAFDQVSLSEDTAGSAPSVTEVHSPPVRERGLASLLDPQTLSAVEDLLNMPKSAAFERGMSRLFKGVKSSATSIFASPLTQPQAKAVETLDESALKIDSAAPQEAGNPAAALPQQYIPTNAPTDLSSQFTAHSASQDGPFLELRKTPEPGAEVLSSVPTVDHWGAPSATSKSPGSAHDLLALIANSSGEPQHMTYAPALAKDASLVGAMEPNHAIHVPELLPVTEPEHRVPPRENHAPHLENRMSEPESHLPEPEYRMSEFQHHVPQPEYHVPEPEVHVHEPRVHMSQTEFHEFKTEYHVPEQEHQVPEPYRPTIERDHGKPEPEHYVPPAAPSNSGVPTYISGTHADTDTQETQLPPMSWIENKSHSVVEDEAHDSRIEYAEKSVHSYSRTSAEQTSGQPLESPLHIRQPLSPEFNKHLHYAPVGPPHPRASSPSVLDREVLLKKQAAVSALQATGAGARARPDKKERLLEKARELLERRQQSSASQSPVCSADKSIASILGALKLRASI